MCMTKGEKGNDDIQRYDNFNLNNEKISENHELNEYSYKMETETKEFSVETMHKEDNKTIEKEPTQSQVVDSISKIAGNISSMANSLYSHVPENIRDGISTAYSKAIDIYQGAKEIFINEIKPELANIGDAMGDLIIAGLEKISDAMGWSDNSTETQLWTRINEHEEYLGDKFESSAVEKYEALNDFLAEKAGVASDERFISLPELKEQFDSGEINKYGYVGGMQDDEKFFQIFSIAEERMELANKYEEAFTAAVEKGDIVETDEGRYIVVSEIDISADVTIFPGESIESPEQVQDALLSDVYDIYRDFSNDDITYEDLENKIYHMETLNEYNSVSAVVSEGTEDTYNDPDLEPNKTSIYVQEFIEAFTPNYSK